MTEKLLTIKETAERLSASEVSVRRWIKAGKLAHVRIERNIRISEQAISDYISKRTRIGY